MARKAPLRLTIGRFYRALSTSLTQGEILQSAIVIAYYLLFSIFPVIIIIGNVLPLFHIPTAPIADYLSLIFPSEVSRYLMPIITGLLKDQSTGYMSFGIILAIWSFSSLVNAIRIGMNRLYDVHKVELKLSLLNFLWTRTFTVLLTALLIIVFTAISLLFLFGQQVLNFLGQIFHLSFSGVYRIFSYRNLVVTGLMFIAVVYLNFVLPNIKVKRRIIVPGSIITVSGWVLLSYGFAYYLAHFPITWKNYGIVGTFIIFMLWLNLAAFLLLFGTSINAALSKICYGRLEYSAGQVASYIQHQRHS